MFVFNIDITRAREAFGIIADEEVDQAFAHFGTEIAKFAGKASERGFTLVPLRLYFKQGRAKVEVAVGRGKQVHDKREAKKKADAQREIRRAMSDH